MDTPPEPSRPGLWAASLSPDRGDARAARLELAARYWYSVYAYLRSVEPEPEAAAVRAEVALTRFIEEQPEGHPLLRERFLEVASEAPDDQLEAEPLLAIDRDWAAERFEAEDEIARGETFFRRWSRELRQDALASLEREYEAAGQGEALAVMQQYLDFTGQPVSDEACQDLGETLGTNEDAARLAIFDLRARYRELLLSILADTAAYKEQTDSELNAILGLPPSRVASLAPTSPLETKGPRVAGPPPVKTSVAGAPAWNPPTVEETALLFPGFEVIAELGRGGMGAVYQARQQSLDRLVAIKLLPLEISVDPSFADRFRREAKAMARLNHPHIISVFDFGQTNEGHLFIVMEYVNGASLHHCIHGGGEAVCPTLEPAMALGLLEQVCEALAYTHDLGIIHCDIKPANMMVDSRGRAKVADFGLARLADVTAAEQGGHLVNGVVMGTPEYSSPEQKEGGHVDLRTDIYSLGVTLYEALCKETPKDPIELPSQRLGLPKTLDAIITRALEADPDRRFQSAAEMKAALAEARLGLRPGKGLAAWNVLWPSIASRLPQRTSLRVALAAGVLVFFVIDAMFVFRGREPRRVAANLDAAKSSGALATPAPEPAATPSPATPAPEPTVAQNDSASATEPAKNDESTPAATPAPEKKPEPPVKAPSAVEKWLATLDAQMKEQFARQVTQPYQTAAGNLRLSYQAALERGLKAASTAGRLDEAVIWRAERDQFVAASSNVPSVDSDEPAAILKPLRAAFRTQLAKLDKDRTERAREMFAKYDAVLTPNVTALTQRERLDDAMLLKNKREELLKEWLPPTPSGFKPLASGTSTPPAATPAPEADPKLTTEEANQAAAAAIRAVILDYVSHVTRWGVTLNMDDRAISDMAPLRPLPIDWLSLRHTKVSDIGPLRGMRLKIITVDHTAVKDVSPLLDMPILEAASIPKKATNIEVLRGHPSLKYLGWEGDFSLDTERPRLTVDEFWARFDALKEAETK